MFLHSLMVIGFAFILSKEFKLPSRQFSIRDNWALDIFFAYFGPNIILKFYLVIVVHCTQSLAFKRLLHVKQSLTSVHDKTTAWLGLPSAAMTLLHYRDVFSRPGRSRNNLRAFAGMLAIVLYLAAALALSSLAPALLYSGLDDFSDQQYDNLTDYVGEVGGSEQHIKEASPGISALEPTTLRWTTNIGLQNNLIYNFPYGTARSSIPTKGIQFVVNCSIMSDAVSQGYNASRGEFLFRLHPDLEEMFIIPASERSLQILSPQFKANTSRPTLIFATSFQIRDNHTTPAAMVPLGDTITSHGCPANSVCNVITKVSILGCNVGYSTHSVSYDSSFTTPWVNYEYEGVASPTWKAWSAPDAPEGDVLSLISKFPTLSPSSGRDQSYTVGNDTTQWTLPFSMLEQQLMELLGLHSWDFEFVLLENINRYLELALATIFWRGTLNRLFENADAGKSSPPPNADPRYTFMVHVPATACALALSALMTILAFLLTRLPQGDPRKIMDEERISTPGALQLAWLMGKRLWIAEEMAKAADPSTSALRKQGKNIVQCFVQPTEEKQLVSDGASQDLHLATRKRTSWKSEDDGLESGLPR